MLFAEEPVYKNISISILERIGRLLLRPAEERRIAQGHVDRLRIRPYSVEPELRKLSGGNQQKVALARWLTHLPRVLVLAEPTRGMDVGAKDDVVKIVRGLKEQGVGRDRGLGRARDRAGPGRPDHGACARARSRASSRTRR